MENLQKIICFDADDTLWINEINYRETENKFQSLLADFANQDKVLEELLATEISNLELYGFGAKSFALSMIETAIKLGHDKLPIAIIDKIIRLAKELIKKPLILYDEVEETLHELQNRGYKLIVATKGDLLDQERKLEASGLLEYFDHTEIMSDKKAGNYKQLINKLDLDIEHFCMIGNSMKSDILPVFEIGGTAIYIPQSTTWANEIAKHPENKNRFHECKHFAEILEIL